MNKYSSRVTQPRSQGASQAMLYGVGLTDADLQKAQERGAKDAAADVAATADGPTVVARRDGCANGALGALAMATRDAVALCSGRARSADCHVSQSVCTNPSPGASVR